MKSQRKSFTSKKKNSSFQFRFSLFSFENLNMYKVFAYRTSSCPPIMSLFQFQFQVMHDIESIFLLYEVVKYDNVRIIKQINCHHLDWTVQTLPCCDMLMDMMLCIECEIFLYFLLQSWSLVFGEVVLGEDFV